MEDKPLELLDQIIDFAEQADLRHKRESIAKNNASQSVGESWFVFNLKNLRELIVLESDATSGDNSPIQEKE